MRAGLLSQRVTIERPVDAQDLQGGVARTWAPALETWASVTPFGERDQQFYGQLYPRASHEVSVRYTDKIRRGDRLNMGGRLLDVVTLRNVDERGQDLRMICSERQ